MRGFVEQLMLAEKAAENIYFAKVDRELIESLHKRMQAGEPFLSAFRSVSEAQTGDSPVVVKVANGG